MIEPFKTKAEMTAAIRDPRYKKDRAYELVVRDRIIASNFEETTGVSINGSLKPQSDAPVDFQDGDGVFHSKAEAMLLMKSQEYKTDPYYREMVARALDASIPDSSVHHVDGRVQIQGEISGSEKPKQKLEEMFDDNDNNDGDEDLAVGGKKS